MIHPIDAMQRAVDIVLSSPHPDNKVAATLFNHDTSLSLTNDWPPAIVQKLGTDQRIGDSSGTVHAEVNCLLHSTFAAQGASLAITDPCCPNCAKSIAEAGIKEVYIDHKGFEKDFATRRGDEFQDMSLRILAHAGITIYEVSRKLNHIRILHKPDEGYIPPEDNPIEIRPSRATASLETLMQTARLVKIKHLRWGCALATNGHGKLWTLVASTHPAVGYTQAAMDIKDGKYDFMLEPVNRILMGAAKSGLKLEPNMMWLSSLPTPREMVNIVAAGMKAVYIGDMDLAKKETSDAARDVLEGKGILQFHTAPLKST